MTLHVTSLVASGATAKAAAIELRIKKAKVHIERGMHAVESDAPLTALGFLFASFETNLNVLTNLVASFRHFHRQQFDTKLFPNIGAFMSNCCLYPEEHPAAALERILATISEFMKPNSHIALREFGVPIDHATGLPVVMSQRSIMNVIILGLHEQLKRAPPIHAACLSDEDVDKARACLFQTPEFNAVMDKLAKVNYEPPPAPRADPSNQVTFGLVSGQSGKGGPRGNGGDGGKGGNPGSGHGGSGHGGSTRGQGYGQGSGGGGGSGHSGSQGNTRKGGRELTRADGTKPRSSSARPGEHLPQHYYGQAISIIGPEFGNIEQVLTELDTHLTVTLKKPHGPFVKNKSGGFAFPLRLMDGYKWKAQREHHNFNIRRDFYGLWQLLRDLFTAGTASNKHGVMTKTGQEYITMNPGSTWKVLTPAEFMAKFKRATSSTPFKDTTVTIAGESVMQFRA
jgi:hypothetical protein